MFLDGRRLWRSSTALENFSGLTGTLSGRWCQRTPAGLSALHLRRSLFWCSLLAADLEAVQHVSLLVGQNSSVLALVLTGLRLQLQSWACEIQHYLENHVKMNSTFETMTKDGTLIFWNVGEHRLTAVAAAWRVVGAGLGEKLQAWRQRVLQEVHVEVILTLHGLLYTQLKNVGEVAGGVEAQIHNRIPNTEEENSGVSVNSVTVELSWSLSGCLEKDFRNSLLNISSLTSHILFNFIV